MLFLIYIGRWENCIKYSSLAFTFYRPKCRILLKKGADLLKEQIKSNYKKDKKYYKIGFILAVIAFATIIILPMWDSRPAHSVENAANRVYGKNNVLQLEHYPATESMHSRTIIKVLIKNLWNEESYNIIFIPKIIDFCKLIDDFEYIEEIIIIGYAEGYDSKGNEKLIKHVTFTSSKEQRINVNWKNFKDLVTLDKSMINNIGKLEF